VVYNNRFGEARGWVKMSSAFAQKTGEGDGKALVQRTLAEGLGLEPGDGWYSIARDQVSGLEFIRSNHQLRAEGLYFELGAYRRLVFTGFRQVQDDAYGQYAQLTEYLGGRGVPSVDEALREIRLQPIRRPYAALVNPDVLRWLLDVQVEAAGPGVSLDVAVLHDVENRLRHFLEEAARLDGSDAEIEPLVRASIVQLGAVLELLASSSAAVPANDDAGMVDDESAALFASSDDDDADQPLAQTNGVSNGASNGAGVSGTGTAGSREPAAGNVTADESEVVDDSGTAGGSALATELLRGHPEARAALLIWALTRPLGGLVAPQHAAQHRRALFDEWLLGATAEHSLAGLGLDDGAAMVGVALTRVLLAHDGALNVGPSQGPRRVLETLLQDGDVRDLLGVNRYRDVLWFGQERFDGLVAGLLATAVVTASTTPAPGSAPDAQVGTPETPVTAERKPSSGTASHEDSGTSEAPAPNAAPAGPTPSASPSAGGAQASATGDSSLPAAAPATGGVAGAAALARALRAAEAQSGFQLDRLLRLLPT
jgi:hypothetical protein